MIQTNIYFVQRYFVWIKQILFNWNKSFVWIKKSLSNKLFSSIQSNLFSDCIYNLNTPFEWNACALSHYAIKINYFSSRPAIERPGLESQRSRKRLFFHRRIFKFFKYLNLYYKWTCGFYLSKISTKKIHSLAEFISEKLVSNVSFFFSNSENYSIKIRKASVLQFRHLTITSHVRGCLVFESNCFSV